MMKKWLLVVLFILPIVYGEISITNIESAYNIGESISPAVSVDLDKSFLGFTTGIIECGNYENDFFKSQLVADGPVEIQVLALTTFSAMKGECNLRIVLEDLEKGLRKV